MNSFDMLYNTVMEEVAISTSLNYVLEQEVCKINSEISQEDDIDNKPDEHK